jgi:hypothetical protein
MREREVPPSERASPLCFIVFKKITFKEVEHVSTTKVKRKTFFLECTKEIEERRGKRERRKREEKRELREERRREKI